MSWFFIDDGFHAHPKHAEFPTECEAGPRTADEVELAAIGLWSKAGSWCRDKLTGGHVPFGQVRKLGGRPEHAEFLVAAGWWERTERGYVFHDWEEWQETAAELDVRKEKDRLQKQSWRRKKKAKQALEAARSGAGREPGSAAASGPDNEDTKSSAGEDRHRTDAGRTPDETVCPGDVRTGQTGHVHPQDRTCPPDMSGESGACPVPVPGIPSPSPDPVPSPNLQPPPPARASAPTRAGVDGPEFEDEPDEWQGHHVPTGLEAPTVELVHDAYTAEFRKRNGNRKPTWTRTNNGHALTVALWVDDELKGGDAAPLVERLIGAFFEHEDAGNAINPIALLASNPAKYLAPRTDRKNGKNSKNGKSRDAFTAPAKPGSYPATDLDAVFGPESRIAEGP